MEGKRIDRGEQIGSGSHGVLEPTTYNEAIYNHLFTYICLFCLFTLHIMR